MKSYIKVYDVSQDLNPNLTFTQGLQELLKDINDNAEVATIYFPAGTYFIEDCLDIPPQVRLTGFSSNFVQHSSNFEHPVTLKATSNFDSFLKPAFKTGRYGFEGVIIENICFDGDKLVNNGFRTNDEVDVSAPNFIIRDCLFRNFIENGIYTGENVDEYFLYNTAVEKCNNGIYINKGRDISLHRIWVSACNNYGIFLFGGGRGGAYKFEDCDIWANYIGVQIEGAKGGSFLRLQIDNSKREGLRIFDCNDLFLTNCIFADNSILVPGSIPHIHINGSAGIVINSSKIGEQQSTIKTNYSIYDSTLNNSKKSNTISNCIFKSSSVTNDIFSNNIYMYYNIDGCFTGIYGEEKLIKDLVYTSVSISLNYRNYKILIASGNTVTLPAGNTVPIGKEFKITKMNIGSLTVKSNSNYRINEINSPYNFDNNSTWITKTFVFAGTDSGVDKWYII